MMDDDSDFSEFTETITEKSPINNNQELREIQVTLNRNLSFVFPLMLVGNISRIS